MKYLVAVFFTVALTGCTHTADECKLKHLGPSMSERAISLISDACEGKYPPPPESLSFFSSEERRQVTGRLGIQGDRATLTVHNGTGGKRISEVQITIFPRAEDSDGEDEPQRYTVTMAVAPYSAGDATFPVAWKGGFAWGVVSISGVSQEVREAPEARLSAPAASSSAFDPSTAGKVNNGGFFNDLIPKAPKK